MNQIKAACFHHHRKVQARAINFFLGNDQKEEEDDSDDSEADLDHDEKRQKEKNEEKLPSARDIMVRFAMKKGIIFPDHNPDGLCKFQVQDKRKK